MPEQISDYEIGLELAIVVIQSAPESDRKTVAKSLLINICSPIGQHCAKTQGVRDAANDFVNRDSIPVWMKYDPLVAA